MSRIEHTFKTQYELIEMLSKSVVRKLKYAIQTKGNASLIVSGGSTPIPLFERLSNTPLEWEQVSVGLCDERWVPFGHEDSNENLVKTYLLQDKASKASFVGMYTEDQDIDAAEVLCDQKMKDVLFPFDVVILGMGNDAHTASLFPGNVKLNEAFDPNNEKLCLAIEPGDAPHMRMSLTRQAILSAEHIYLHFEGTKKYDLYKEVISGDDMYKMPVRSILNQDMKDVEVYYI